MKKASLIILWGLVCVLMISAQQEDRLFREAERRFQKGDYQFAFSRYEQLILEYPDSRYIADAKFRQAVIYTYIDENKKAIDLLERISDRYPSTRFSGAVPFWQGYNYFLIDDFQQAISYFSGYLRDKSDSLIPDALYYKSLSERNIDRREEAFETARELFQLYDSPIDNPQALLLYSSLLVETGRYQQLFELYRELPIQLLDEPYRGRVSLYRAEALFQQGRLEEAEPLFLELLSKDDDIRTTAFKRLFVLYARSGEKDKQTDIFDKAQTELAGSPELLAEFLLRVGIQNYKEGDYDLSRSYLRRIRRTLPLKELDGLVPLYLALNYEKSGEIEDAIGILQEYMAVSDDEHEELFFALGRIESIRENWERSAEIYGTFLNEYPDSLHIDEAQYLYAYALYRIGKAGEALTVVQESFSGGEGASLDRQLLRLRSRLYAEMGRTGMAIQDLEEYIPRYQQDTGAYIDLMKLYFQEGSYQKAHRLREEAEEVFDFPEGSPAFVEAGQSQKIETFIQILYIDGSAYLEEGAYERASDLFNRIWDYDVSSFGLEELLPHLLFYQGWIAYKQGEYAEAVDWFSRLREEHPESARTVDSVYLSGWAAFAGGDYLNAQQSFGKHSRSELPQDEKVRGLFMYAKSSAALGKSEDALLMYRTIYTDFPESLLADDALFDYAALLHSLDRFEEAAESYYTVYTRYPASPLGEDALFRRGDLLYRKGQYDEARDAFYEHRVRYPEGSMLDVSLYWSGHAALKVNQPYGAVLVWEKLTRQYPRSSFYSETLMELAGLYSELGEYQQAVSAYTSYLASNPAESAGREARRQIDTLKRIMAGQDSREAELSVLIDREGYASAKGIEAATELARLYLYQYPEKVEEAFELLRKVERQGSITDRQTAETQYLTGEYHRKKGNPGKAAVAYAEAAVRGAGDDDFVARSLLKSAESAAEAGDAPAARQMVRKLKAEFPNTQWVIEGERLLSEIDRRNRKGE